MVKRMGCVEIQNHVSKIKIHGWEGYKNFRLESARVNYRGIADGKKFNYTSKGSERIGDIIDNICKEVTE